MIVLDEEESFEEVRKKLGRNGEVPFIVISENGKNRTEHRGVRILPKPLEAGRFLEVLYSHFGSDLSPEKSPRCDFRAIDSYAMGSSPAMKEIRDNILRVSDTTLPVLIQGETGSGKGVVARLLHHFSSRDPERYMEINCASIPQNLMESELFGHRQGAFTGAWKDKTGRFQMAAEGSVFLDEISEMSSYMQAKLLHVLQDGEFSPVGSTANVKVDIRIIAATNADIKQMMSESLFRKDLYYRLAVISLYLPPLRERKEDVEILATYFLEKYSRLYNKKHIRISPKLKRMFDVHQWPGNVRELENMIRTLVALENEEQILDELQSRTGRNPAAEYPVYPGLVKDGHRPGLKEITDNALAEAEKDLIAEALSSVGGNKKQAAGLLKVSYKSLLNKIKTYGL